MASRKSLTFKHFARFFGLDCGSSSFLPFVLLTFMFSQFSESGSFLTSSLFTLLSYHFSLTFLCFTLESGLLFHPDSFCLFLSQIRFPCKSCLFLLLDTKGFQTCFLFSANSLSLFCLSLKSCHQCSLLSQLTLPLFFSTSMLFFDALSLLFLSGRNGSFHLKPSSLLLFSPLSLSFLLS